MVVPRAFEQVKRSFISEERLPIGGEALFCLLIVEVSQETEVIQII